MSRSPRTPPLEKLTRREREIMNAVFALGNRASAEDVRTRLLHPPSYSAVRAMLVRLEAKGYLRHHEEGARYIYSATTSPASARRAALQQQLQVFFRRLRWSDDLGAAQAGTMDERGNLTRCRPR